MTRGFRVSNPVFNEKTINEGYEQTSSTPMTMKGAIQKSGILLLILVASAVVGWQIDNMAVTVVSALVGVGICFFLNFKRNLSPYVAPVFAIVEGIFVGGMSVYADRMVQESDYAWGAGIVPVAIAGTMVVFGVMLALYATRIIKVTQTFKMVAVGGLTAVFLVYMGSFLLSFIWPGVSNIPIFGSGPIGIIFSMIVIGLAAMNLAVDFDLIEKGAQNKLPKYMEWFAGFALLVTLVWLYIEILRLLMKLASSNR